MDVDENLKQTYIQYDPAPRKGDEVLKKRVPDYFL
jgi:serine/threonine-protein phosphatase 2A catalytic subunit